MKGTFIEKLFELRRSAYVDALMSMRQYNNVIGTFGEGMDEAVFYAFNMVCVPIVGVDRHIFQYGKYDGCDPVKSTMIYLKTDKCPLLFSSRAFVIKPKCAPMMDAFLKNVTKPVHLYRNSDDLKLFLEELTGRPLNPRKYEMGKEILFQIHEKIDEIRHSSISGYEFSVLKFYSHYILDLEKRLMFLENIKDNFIPKENIHPLRVTVCCPRGLMEQVRKEIGHDDFEIFEVDEDADFSCERCVKHATFQINY